MVHQCIDPLLVIIHYDLFILTINYCKNFTTRLLLTKEHMAMFVVKSIVIEINCKVMDLSIIHCNLIVNLVGFHFYIINICVWYNISVAWN